MMIIPAIDLRAGRCVRLRQGDFSQETVFAGDPVAIAKEWERQGARRLHVVDLDGARTGVPENLPIVRNIVNAVSISVQLGGGMRSDQVIEEAFAVGVERVVVGTRAVLDPAWVTYLTAAYGERVLVGLDARSGRVAVEGWRQTSNQSALALARHLHGVCGVQEFIYTDIGKDGTLAGPDIDGLRALLDHGFKVIASGGVSSLQDLRALKPLTDSGLSAVIVGTALYTGQLDLRQALSV